MFPFKRVTIVTFVMKNGKEVTVRCSKLSYKLNNYTWTEKPSWLYPTQIVTLDINDILFVKYRRGFGLCKKD